jgi:hypothetical protein
MAGRLRIQLIMLLHPRLLGVNFVHGGALAHNGQRRILAPFFILAFFPTFLKSRLLPQLFPDYSVAVATAVPLEIPSISRPIFSAADGKTAAVVHLL